MTNHKQSAKRNRQRLRRRQRNVLHLSKMRTFIKRVRKQLDDGDVAAAKESLPLALGAIGRAASKGVIHQNTASRYVSRLNLAMNRAAAG